MIGSFIEDQISLVNRPDNVPKVLINANQILLQQVSSCHLFQPSQNFNQVLKVPGFQLANNIAQAPELPLTNHLTAQSIEKPVKDTRRFNDEKWAYRFHELCQFRRTYGHCFVPHTFPPNPFLARWVKRQRRQYKLMLEGKHSAITPERVAILDEAGFVWDSHEAIWRTRLHQLREYKKINGNCLVPSNFAKDPQLATWVKCQRRQYKLYWEGKSCGITAERIKHLETIGFEWELRPSPKGEACNDADYLLIAEALRNAV